MKKILSLILVAVMLMSMTVTAFAADGQSGTSTVTAVVPDPTYTIHIPADMTLVYGNGARHEVGKVYVTNAQYIPDGTLILASMEATPLKSTEGNVIPVVFEYDRNDGDYKDITKNIATVYKEAEDEYLTAYLYARVTEEDWEAAKPGTYISTITYSFEIFAV